MKTNKVLDALLGVAVGDALGVPFEFRSREQMAAEPAKDMVGYGTHNQSPGTWSDDSSLTFCLAHSLTNGYVLIDIAHNFIKWRYEAYWTARGNIFNIGNTTLSAIRRLKHLFETNDISGLMQQKLYGEEFENGNGSLMRILPLLFYIKGKPIKKQFDITWEVSALTHRHIRAAMACFIYLKLAEKLLEGKDKIVAYQNMRNEIAEFWDTIDFADEERTLFSKVIQNDIRDTPIEDLKTGGYVMEVLESSIWFLLNKDSYEETVLSIINLGHDTDTSAAIAGGLAGIYYGSEGIPKYWLASIARLEDIIELGGKLNEKYCD